MIVKTREDLREELKEQNITQQKFANQYYLEEVDKNEDALEKHFERFKDLLKKEAVNDKSPERLAAYINFFNRKYKKNGIFTQADRYAAWELFVEIDTRIVTKILVHGHGIEQAALKSIYQLFELHRDIAKRHGPNCRSYYRITQEYFENYIRPFTSKWHKELNDNNGEQFREELTGLQVEISNLKSKLNEIIV